MHEGSMKILVINCGSSSFKFRLFEMGKDHVEPLFSGFFDALNIKKFDPDGVFSHGRAAQLAVQALMDADSGVISSLDEITAVGHRVVHGGEKFVAPAVIDSDVIAAIEACSALAPLHNPINLEGIRAARHLLPDIPHVAVFDTAFHQSLEPKAFLYAIPYEYYTAHGIRRYGFHGSSHKYVFHEAAAFLDQPPEKFKAIICHLGSGSSISAVKGAKVVETSMGFTPLEGLVMGTRCGDLDPSVPFFMARQTGLPFDAIEDILNKKSGLLGISGKSNDMRQVLAAARNGDPRASVAVEVYVHRVIKYIGAYVSVLDGVDAVVFTAGIGEYSPDIRKRIMDQLSWLGITPDEQKNQQVISRNAVISKKGSTTQVLVIPTDEEKEIAKQTFEKTRLR